MRVVGKVGSVEQGIARGEEGRNRKRERTRKKEKKKRAKACFRGTIKTCYLFFWDRGVNWVGPPRAKDVSPCPRSMAQLTLSGLCSRQDKAWIC